jgi:hypothetical protein
MHRRRPQEVVDRDAGLVHLAGRDAERIVGAKDEAQVTGVRGEPRTKQTQSHARGDNWGHAGTSFLAGVKIDAFASVAETRADVLRSR